MEPAKPQVARLPVADITAPLTTKNNVVHQSFAVKRPAEDYSEFLVHVRSSVLTKVRRKVTLLRAGGFPWPELLLGISTLALGAALGAIPAKLEFKSLTGLSFYLVMPVIGSSCLVAYFSLRRNSIVTEQRVAEEILDELPDPEKAR